MLDNAMCRTAECPALSQVIIDWAAQVAKLMFALAITDVLKCLAT